MKTLTAIFLLISLTGCTAAFNQPKKPFIITYKARYLAKDSTYYYFRYCDANGLSFSFFDGNKYSIGDTIK